MTTMLAAQLGTRRRTRMVRNGCTVMTSVRIRNVGATILDTARSPAAMMTMAATTNSPEEAVASADAGDAGRGARAAVGPLSSRAEGMEPLSGRAASEAMARHGDRSMVSSRVTAASVARYSATLGS